MEPDPVKSPTRNIGLSADHTGSFASEEKEVENIPGPSEITEKDSNIEQVMKHPPPPPEGNNDKKSTDDEMTKRQEEEEEKKKKDEERLNRYLPLYKAALKGDWETAKSIIENDSDALTATITFKRETVLHVAVSNDGAIKFVEKLLQKFTTNEESLATLTSARGATTVLSYAAVVGNTKAAELLVKMNPKLLEIRNFSRNTPLHLAAKFRHKKTLDYLLSKSKEVKPSLLTQESGARLLILLIGSDFYGVALDLLKDNPNLALHHTMGTTALEKLGSKPWAFKSGSRLGYWQRIIYQFVFAGISVEMDNVPLKSNEMRGDVESPATPIETSQKFPPKSTNHIFLHQISSLFVFAFKHIHNEMLMHKQTHELVKRMCKEVTLSGANALELLKTPLFEATRLGIVEIVAEIIKTNPNLMWARDEDRRHVFQLAVLHRQEKIFNLLYQMGSSKFLHADIVDKLGNNLLHLAGEFAPSTCISGAALQMQRKLQWFKEVENFVEPSFIWRKNSHGKTPREVFTEAHVGLVKKGEKWMKNISSSCTVVVALTVTMMFAAAFTAPGGEGFKVFLNKSSFMVFAISDAIGLFSSCTSLLMFLGMLTTRYSEDDFLKSLPNKLIIGLFTLFISIASMVVAFSAALYIVFADQVTWILVPIGLFACVPITLFTLLQYPLLVEIFLSTYGPSIFHKKCEDIFG